MPFDTVSIVLLNLLAITSDGADAATALVFGVPVVGQVIYFANAFLLSPIIWAIIQVWFIMKLGIFGRAGVLNLVGGIANLIGIPGTTITTNIAIWVANHPKLTAVATAAATGGTGAIAKGGAAATGKAAAKGTAGAIRETAQAGKAATLTQKETAALESYRKHGYAGLTEEKFLKGKEEGIYKETGAEPPKPAGEAPTPFEQLQKLAEEPLPEEESEEEEYS